MKALFYVELYTRKKMRACDSKFFQVRVNFAFREMTAAALKITQQNRTKQIKTKPDHRRWIEQVYTVKSKEQNVLIEQKGTKNGREQNSRKSSRIDSLFTCSTALPTNKTKDGAYGASGTVSTVGTFHCWRPVIILMFCSSNNSSNNNDNGFRCSR